MKKFKFVVIVILLLGIFIMLFAGTRIKQIEQIYQMGNESYDILRLRLRGSDTTGSPFDLSTDTDNADHTVGSSATDESAVMDESYVHEPAVDIPDLNISFEILEEINQDAVAWLYCPDTPIDYPVMSAADYSYYLNHLPDGSVNANGSLFIDYNNASDFSEPLTVIYGHHMRSGKMFGSLVKYKDQSYFDEFPYMFIYTDHGNYRIDLLYGCVIGAGQWRNRAFMYSENVSSLLAYARHHTVFNSGLVYTGNDRFVVLSTCSYEFNDARFILVGILRSEF